MSQEKDKYSLWLVPKGESGEKLQALVDKLAEENKAPHFTPHLTLVANIFANLHELENITEQIRQCAEHIGSFTVRLTEYGYLDEEFRCLYLLSDSPQIQAVYEQVSTIFPQIKKEHFQSMPHLSVLYGNFPDETKTEIIARNPMKPFELTISSFDLYLTNDPVESWQLVQVFPLAVTED